MLDGELEAVALIGDVAGVLAKAVFAALDKGLLGALRGDFSSQ